ncbi:hypothetical protein [Pseudalkalibacillus berkeleyi]|uniref:Amidohydrolase-related domain-containing protein n=1 Tax=Pseudalkalibacillus berkeleyi TaxID=1069813 RepID=A0ABS9H181_9BACL|nr:hypothetical protein [Pseudalkalibacillus berkeleyi]MCF6137570.1 hypothetical protein [Pseudalkalibacillus berkeleyi]
MEYILENVWTTDRNPKQKHVYVKDNVIRYVSERPLKMKCFTVNSSGFDVIPGYVCRDFSIADMDETSIQNCCEDLVKNGCTSVVTIVPLTFPKEYDRKISDLRTKLATMPLDYVIGVQVPMSRISPSLIRTCQKAKIPFINAVVEQEEDLDTVIWEWIRNVNFPYTVPIIADWSQLPLHEKRLQQIQEKWVRLCKEKSIITIEEFPNDKERLTKHQLQCIGLYPKKGSWITGSDVDYLVFERIVSVDGEEIVKYDKNKNPVIVVQNGTVIKVRDDLRLMQGAGKEMKIIRPGIFRVMSNDLL